MTRPQLDEISTHVLGGFVYRTIGAVSPSTRDVAEGMMSELSLVAPGSVIRARLKIHHDEERLAAERFLTQASMEVIGRRVRTEAAASTAKEALSLVGQGLDRRLQMISERRQRASKRPPATPGVRWRDGYRAARPHHRHTPPEERLLLRRKSYGAVDTMSVDDALLNLTLLDFRMFLFTDSSDQTASIVYETGEGITLRRVDGTPARPESVSPRLIIDPAPAPLMSSTDAMARMNIDDRPFLYFQDAGRSAAAAIYRRFDGHYGLIVPI